MKTLHVSDEAYEALKTFIIDPFDDTPEQVIIRLMEIVNKARKRWSPFERPKPSKSSERPLEKDTTVPSGTRVPDTALETAEVVL